MVKKVWRTDRRTDARTDWTSHIAAWSQLKIAKNSNFKILYETVHTIHLLKLLDKMCKYEMDPTRTVGVTEQTRDAGWTDGRMDGQTDGQT